MVLAALAGAVAGGCATGVVTEVGFEPIDATAAAGAGGNTAGATSTAHASTSSGAPQGSGGATATNATSATSGAGGAGGMAPMCTYASPNQCSTATVLSAISGDKNSSASYTAQTSQWLKIHVKEDVGSIFPEDLSYTVTLTSPPGMDYDVYVHHGPKGGSTDCNAAPTKGSGNGGSKSVYKKWKDEQGFGGKDDSVWLSIEVRYVSGSECGAAAEWTLVVQGHT